MPESSDRGRRRPLARCDPLPDVRSWYRLLLTVCPSVTIPHSAAPVHRDVRTQWRPCLTGFSAIPAGTGDRLT